MKRVVLASGFIVVTLSVILSGLVPAGATEALPQAPVVEGPVEQILEATVPITLHAIDRQNPSEMITGRGLGTLVTCDGETLIITHNHWGEALDHLVVARFWSRESEMLLELNGLAFKSLIRYRDGGTMILIAPQELIPHVADQADSSRVQFVPAAGLDGSQKVEQGDIVLVAVRQPGEGHGLEIHEAVVESLDPQFGLPCLTLRRLNGKSIEPGDSGGGVWLDGRWVANLWYRITYRVQSTDSTGEETETLRLADLSVAATPPAHRAAEPVQKGGPSAE